MDEVIKERVTRAFAATQVITMRLRQKLARETHLIHRAEILLNDSMEWEFAVALLSEGEYNFIHCFTAMLGTMEDVLPKHRIVTYSEAIALLRAAAFTLELVEKNADNKKYDPSEDPDGKSILATIPKDLMPHFGAIPMVLASCANECYEAKRATREELQGSWRLVVVEKALETLQYANKLLLERGLGDRA